MSTLLLSKARSLRKKYQPGLFNAPERIRRERRLRQPARNPVALEGESTLASAYRACLQLCEQQAPRTIAFPAISTGIYGYPLEDATLVAVSTVRAFVAGRQSLVERVIFACFDDATLHAYEQCGVPVN